MRRSLVVLCFAACADANRLSEQSDQQIQQLCDEHPIVTGGCIGRDSCNAVHTNSCVDELAKASDDCDATVQDFIDCAGTPECRQ